MKILEMVIDRRNFLKQMAGLTGILIAKSAPAFITDANMARIKTGVIINPNYNPSKGEIISSFGNRNFQDVPINPFIVPDASRPNDWRPEDNSIEAIQNRRDLISSKLPDSIVPDLPYIPGQFVCTEFSHAMQIEFSGFLRQEDEASSGNDPVYENIGNINNRFNMPMYTCGLTVPEAQGYPNGYAHAINAVLTGGYLGDWNSWTFVEPQNGQILIPGETMSLPSNTENLRINMPVYVVNGQDVFSRGGFMVFDSVGEPGRHESIFHNVTIARNGNVGIENPPEEGLVNPELLPRNMDLKANYPNPFNGNTTLTYELARPEEVRLSIYDAKGELVKRLVNTRMPAGNHEIAWNPKNLPSGTYFPRLETRSRVDTGKILFVK
jgi:hypothetical protein